MSSCLSGGGRAIRLDLEIIKSPSTSWTSNSSSPSSTLSESSNSPLAISTRKPRTPRKRPNQTYNEAAAILSTAYPKIFPTKHLTKPCKFTKQQQYLTFPYESSDLLLPFRVIDASSFLVEQHHHHPQILDKPNHHHHNHQSSEQKVTNSCDKPCLSPGEINSKINLLDFEDEFNEDFDAESMLDEEIEEGIDSIMGNSCSEVEPLEEQSDLLCQNNSITTSQMPPLGTCYGYPVGLGFGNYFDYGFGMKNNGIRAFRNHSDGEDWWRFPSVNVHDITPKFQKSPATKKKKKKVEKLVELKNITDPLPKETSNSNSNSNSDSISSSRAVKESSTAQKLSDGEANEAVPNTGLSLKLNIDNVLKDWSDGPSPFSDDSPALADASGTASDVQARLAKIDLFSESGGVREASVLRYKEKRRTRLFSKKIRYQVRKVNADRRPRMKVKTLSLFSYTFAFS
ncbi:OLC1v1036035C3 [Oldenlandia corymbosa var. corymbosa]|uniref:OLC1v1036035C3 n=1 Tax=Oldenlandia corymbosa var. corymbosa TaxID=529605 RepID=A0AAV1CWY3_OLDCO|nr:OLC1v1036035C3 [Oldenlandia corymbosa var. corymbosa]